MNTPLISIVMPAYNSEAVIDQAICSVLNQTYQNWELIIVDDGSDDTTGGIIDSIKLDNVHVYHNKQNMGVAFTRNYGIDKASGEWVAFLDSDDLWQSKKLEKQVEMLRGSNDALLLFTGSAFVRNNGGMMKYQLHVPERVDYNTLLKHNVISCSSVIIKKELLEKHHFPEKKGIHEDFALWLEVLKDIPFAYGLDEPLLIYRLSNKGKSSNKIRSALMNWHTYEYMQVPVLERISAMLAYIVINTAKYSRLK